MEPDDRIPGFCRFLRDEGFGMGIQQTLDASRGCAFDQTSRTGSFERMFTPGSVRIARGVGAVSELFEEFWQGRLRKRKPAREAAG